MSLQATTLTPAAFTANCEAVSGLGDAACWDSTQLILSVLKGNLEINIQGGADVVGQGGYMGNFGTLAAKIVAAL